MARSSQSLRTPRTNIGQKKNTTSTGVELFDRMFKSQRTRLDAKSTMRRSTQHGLCRWTKKNEKKRRNTTPNHDTFRWVLNARPMPTKKNTHNDHMEIRSSDAWLATNIGRTCLMSTTLQSITWRAGLPRHSKPSCHTCLEQNLLRLTPALQQSPLLVKPCVVLVCGHTCKLLRCDCGHVRNTHTTITWRYDLRTLGWQQTLDERV